MVEGGEIGLACCRCHGAKYGGNRLRCLRRKPSCSRPVSERRRTKDQRPKTKDRRVRGSTTTRTAEHTRASHAPQSPFASSAVSRRPDRRGAGTPATGAASGCASAHLHDE